jgi:cellulose synthase/poly-beta-1,6-N-acetylglucosamine synthase-like glycosyltransferase
VLVPAHDEEAGIARTLRSAAAQLGPTDRILVVADNCTDRTTAVARAHGAGAVERTDAVRRGKGYALAFGRDALRADPPEVVIVLDADCELGEHALARLAAAAAATGRPAQAAYRMTAPHGAGPQRQVAAFAFLLKNVVRPLGLRRLGGPCLLTGTGMAFPWAVFRDAPLGDGHIVEDMGVTVELAAAGRPPVFVPDAGVTAEFPADDRAAGSQRRRWEHGHLRVMLAGVPRLLAAAVARRRLAPLAVALEIAVPPLSALVLGSAVLLAFLAAWAVAGGDPEPAFALLGTGVFAAAAVAAVWVRYGRSALPVAALTRVPAYAVGKLPLYARFLVRPERNWVRTARAARPGDA